MNTSKIPSLIRYIVGLVTTVQKATIGIGYRYRWFDLSYSMIKKIDIKELGDTDMDQLALGVQFAF